MTKETWKACYQKLTKAYSKPVDVEQMRVYFEALVGERDERVQVAVNEAIKICKHWPSVADIREQIGKLVTKYPPVPDYPPMSDEQRDQMLAAIQAAKTKIFGRSLQ